MNFILDTDKDGAGNPYKYATTTTAGTIDGTGTIDTFAELATIDSNTP